MRQKYLIVIILLIMIVGIVAGLLLSNRGQEQMQDLVLIERGIRITAPVEDVEKYIEARKSGIDSATLELMLEDILSNSKCQITELPDRGK